MTPLAFAVGFYLIAWILLTASLVFQHLTDRDGVAAVIWAFVPTVLILATSYANAKTSVVTQDTVAIMMAGGLFILTGVNLSKAVRRWHRGRSQRDK